MKQKEPPTEESQEILDLLSEYSKALSILEQYDAGTLKEPKGLPAQAGAPAKFVLEYEDAAKIIKIIKAEIIGKKAAPKRGEPRPVPGREAGSLFGSERGGMFEGIVKNLYQTFGGKELYDTAQKKAAHLLYLTIKDHPFSDGNKRIGAFLFVYFLNKNNYLCRENGERKIDNNALAALALLIAESNPKEKDVMVKIILNLLA